MKTESYHLMSVPRSFVTKVLQNGGKLLQLKSNQWKGVNELQLLQSTEDTSDKICIREPNQHTNYELMGQEYAEDIALCKSVFIQNHTQTYRIFTGTVDLVTCEECKRTLKQYQRD